MRRTVLLAALILGLAGCDGEAPPAGSTDSVRDSAGIRIVESAPRPGGASPFTVSPEPAITIGDDPSRGLEYTFQAITDAKGLPDGRILIASYGPVRAYHGDGSYAADFRAPSSGAERFRALPWFLQVQGDTALVVETPGSSVAVYDLGGTLVRRVPVPFREWMEDPGPDQVSTAPLRGAEGRFADGSYLVRLSGLTSTASGLQPEIVTFVRFDEQSGAVDTLGAFSAGARDLEAVGGRWQKAPGHFPPDLFMAIEDDRVHVGNGTAYQFTTVGEEGDPIRIARLIQPRLPVTRSIRRAWEERNLQVLRRAARQGVVTEESRKRLEATPFPDSLPTFTEARVDARGYVWLETFPDRDWDDPAYRHFVFDGDGVLLGTVDTPRGLRVTDIGDEWILGIATAEGGTQSVRMYRLEGG